MAKKKPKDQHKSGFMVRLSEEHRPPLEALKRKHRRAITTEVKIALEKHYKSEGVPFKPGGETPE